MRRSSPLLAVLLALTPSLAHAQVWEAAPAFPTGITVRSHSVGVLSQGSLYAIGGTPFTTGLDGVSHELPPGGGAWLAAGDVEGTIVGAGAGVDGLGRIVVFGGGAMIGDDKGKTYVWDPIEGKKDTLGNRSSAAPVTGFAWATDSLGRLYSIGGGPGASATPSDPNVGRVERYDATANSWTVLAPLPTPVAGAAATFDGGDHVIVVGGFTATGGVRTTNVARYSIANGTWSDTAIPDLPVALSGARAVLGSDERIYVVGGSNGSSLATTWMLDATHSTWTAGPSLAVAREEFAAALGPDDYLYVMGGLGTATCERLFTPPCPTFTTQPTDATAWTGLSTSFSVGVAGGEPFSYQWRKGGLLLSDGTSASGGFISGSTSATLVLSGVGSADAGTYDVVVTNACGSVTSDPAEVTVRNPPSIGTEWTFKLIHPAGALSSVANSVDETTIGGSAAYTHAQYGSLAHPMLWPKGGGAPTDMTPAGSVGGAINDVAPGTQVGWYWWPYQTPQGTGYHKHACAWHDTVASLTDIQIGGSLEYGEARATDGTVHVGFAFGDYPIPGAGLYWKQENKSPTSFGSVSVQAIFGGNQYGSDSSHATKWSGSVASQVDIHPSIASSSAVRDANLGLQVGDATIGSSHAAVWAGSAGTFVDLNPVGATFSYLYSTHGGVQVGSAGIGGTGRATLWAGSASSTVDLHALLPPEYSSSVAYGVHVDAFGTITVVGYGYDSVQQRSEAVLWRQNPQMLSGDVPSITASAGGTQQQFLFGGSEHAGKGYWILGSVSGTTPGIPINPWITLPLAYDFYTLFTLNNPNSPLLPGSYGTFDAAGTATAAFVVPPLALPFPVTIHHAFVVLDGAAGPVDASNALAVELVP